MTTQPRALVTPALQSQAFAARATARSVHAFTLAELANDAASGHPGQRWSISRRESGTFHSFYESSTPAAWLVVRAVLTVKGGPIPADVSTLALTVDDGTSTASSLADGIPDGLRGDQSFHIPPLTEARRRHEVLNGHRWVISLATLRAVLSASTRWRISLSATIASSHYLESFTIEEISRLAVDTADTFGQLPQNYLPRGVVVDGASGLQRIGATLEAAFDLSRRTYHASSIAEATPWTTTSTSYAVLTGDAEPGGAAIQYVTRGRRMRVATDARVRFRVRYKTTAGQTASIRLHTGAGTYTLALGDTSGAWADSDVATAYLKTSGVGYLDAITWDAKCTGGTLSVSARCVWDHPL